MSTAAAELEAELATLRAEFPELSPAPQPQLSFAEMDDNQLLAAALEASRVEPSPTPTAAPSAALRPSSPRESWSRATEGMTAAPSVVQQALIFLDEAGAGRGLSAAPVHLRVGSTNPNDICGRG